jgi:hypothetical protein
VVLCCALFELGVVAAAAWLCLHGRHWRQGHVNSGLVVLLVCLFQWVLALVSGMEGCAMQACRRMPSPASRPVWAGCGCVDQYSSTFFQHMLCWQGKYSSVGKYSSHACCAGRGSTHQCVQSVQPIASYWCVGLYLAESCQLKADYPGCRACNNSPSPRCVLHIQQVTINNMNDPVQCQLNQPAACCVTAAASATMPAIAMLSMAPLEPSWL